MAPPRILIVDDDAAVSFALQRLLELVGGMHALVTHTADEAEAELVRSPVDAMVIDFHLRGMRGDAFFHRACQVQPSLARQTVFITGDMSPEANDAITSTTAPFLLKPFLATELIETLRSLTMPATMSDARTA